MSVSSSKCVMCFLWCCLHGVDSLLVSVKGGVREALAAILPKKLAVAQSDVVDLVAGAAAVHALPLLRGLLSFSGFSQRRNTQQQESGRSNQQNGHLLCCYTLSFKLSLRKFAPVQLSWLFGKSLCHSPVTAVADPLWFSLSLLYYDFQSAMAIIHTPNVISPSLSSGVTALRISSGWQLSPVNKMSNISQNDKLNDKQISNSHISAWEHFADCKVSLLF